MSPALRDGDLILVTPARKGQESYDRGAVVIARLPASGAPDADETVSVKRVVGLPGEYVRAGRDGSMWIEGELLPEPYLTPAARAAPGSGLSWPCDSSEYVLMGDNRGDSWGGRQLTPVPVSKIIGKMWLRLPTHALLGRSKPGRTRPTR